MHFWLGLTRLGCAGAAGIERQRRAKAVTRVVVAADSTCWQQLLAQSRVVHPRIRRLSARTAVRRPPNQLRLDRREGDVP